MAELGLDDRALVLVILVLVFFLFFVLVLVFGVDVELLAHLLEDVEQGLRRGDAVVTDGDPALELDGQVDLGAEVVRVEAVEELGERLLGEARRDGVRDVLVRAADGRRADASRRSLARVFISSSSRRCESGASSISAMALTVPHQDHRRQCGARSWIFAGRVTPP